MKDVDQRLKEFPDNFKDDYKFFITQPAVNVYHKDKSYRVYKKSDTEVCIVTREGTIFFYVLPIVEYNNLCSTYDFPALDSW